MDSDDTAQSAPRDPDDSVEAWEAARRAAAAEGLSLSAWLSQAIREASAETAERAAAEAARAANVPLPDWLSEAVKEASAAEIGDGASSSGGVVSELAESAASAMERHVRHDRELVRIEEELSGLLGVVVRVALRGPGERGVLTVRFKNLGELQELIERLREGRGQVFTKRNS